MSKQALHLHIIDVTKYCPFGSSKNKHVVHFNVKCGDIIVWKFATKKRDIGFGGLW